MKKLHEEIVIDAPRQKVWETIINKDTYEKWTKPFDENSTYEGTWQKGETLRFLGPEEDGTRSGMISKIAEMRQPEFISIKHVGMIDHDKEMLDGPEVEKWAPSSENYTLTELNDGKTKFELDMDVEDEYQEEFNDMWPKALEILKELSE